MWANPFFAILISLVEGVGFEPTKPFRAPDLQSGGISRSPTPPDIASVYHLSKVHAKPLAWTPKLTSSGATSQPEGGFEPTNLPITNRLRCPCATRASSSDANTTTSPAGEVKLYDNTIPQDLVYTLGWKSHTEGMYTDWGEKSSKGGRKFSPCEVFLTRSGR